MMGDSDVPEDPADPSGWLGARGLRWGPEGPGPYRGGWVLSHPVLQGTAAPTTLHDPPSKTVFLPASKNCLPSAFPPRLRVSV